MRPLVLLFFFVSGLCGLLYEVAWIRMAGTVIGNTTTAIGTVVAVFMAGLGFGAWWGGHAADRRSGGGLLRLYAILEGGIALSALAVPLLLAASEPLFRVLWNSVGEIAPLYAALRAALVAVVLAAPTMLMGATLPVLSRFLAEASPLPPREAGRAYAVNTLGGVAGTLLAGFWLIPAFGLRATTLAAAGLNIMISLSAFRMAHGPSSEVRPTTGPAIALPGLPLLVSALSGLASLVYEVAWTRSLVLVLGSTVYAFTLTLAAFILGLATGSALASWLLPRLADARRSLAVVQSAIGVSALILLPFLGDLPLRVAGQMDAVQGSFGRLLLIQSGLILIFVFIPTLFIGAVFPLACRMAGAASGGVGRSVAAVYTWNTAGSILGSLAASFVLVPGIGLAASVKAAASLNLALAAGLLAPRWKAAVLPVVAATAAWLLLPDWNPKVMASGALFYGSGALRGARQEQVDLRRYLEEDTEILGEYRDAYGLTTVHRQKNGVLSMRVNGKTDASTGPADRINMLFVGHVPLLHHPAPKKALLIGLGAGITLEAMAKHPLDQLDCVEISPAVHSAARAHFRDASGTVLGDPRVRVIEGDGRNLLRFGREPYDVIVSQPSNLWISGMANLFTREFFEEASRRLSKGGVFGQWVHAYRLGTEEFHQVARTFFDVYPHGGLWEIFPGHDYLLVGSLDPLAPVEDLAGRLRSTRALEEYLGPDPAPVLLGYHLGSALLLKEILPRGKPLTDDHCPIEFTAPRALLSDHRAETLKSLQKLHLAGTPHSRGTLAEAVERHAEGNPLAALIPMENFMASNSLDPRTKLFLDLLADGVFERGRWNADVDRLPAAEDILRRIPSAAASFSEAQVELGDVRLRLRNPEGARLAFQAARAADPKSYGAAVGLAHLNERAGRFEEAVRGWQEATTLRDKEPAPWFRLSYGLWKMGRKDEARHACSKAVDLGSKEAKEFLAELR